MITLSDLSILCEESVRAEVERNIERQHTAVALDKSLYHSSLIASQVKYLQRARTKLPMLYAARCIIPSRAYEQCSSEVAASHKRVDGDSVLELTCGLGVDTAALSRRFRRVVTLERDEVLAEVARENFRRLGIDNIEVVTISAEQFLASCEERFDWLYVDPDRRSEDGRKQVLLEDCSPNVLLLWPDIKRVADRVAIKCSPLFDVDEAFRLFPGCRVEVVSLGDECKEVVIYVEGGESVEMLGAVALGRGEVWIERGENNFETPQTIDLESYKYLLIPDVSLQKGRIARKILGEVAEIWSDNGFGFMGDCEGYNPERHLSRCERIEWIGEYDTKLIRKELKARDIRRAEVLKRDTQLSVAQITKQLKISEGGSRKIAVTKLQNRTILAILAR